VGGRREGGGGGGGGGKIVIENANDVSSCVFRYCV